MHFRATLNEKNETLSFITATSLDAAKRQLTEVEALEAAMGTSLPHKLHPSSFVRMGLEIGDQQCGVLL